MPTAAPTPTPLPGATSPGLPAAYGKFSSTVSVTVEGGQLVIRSTGTPDHGSPYFPRSDSRYEAYNGTNGAYHQNPNQITSQTVVYRIPLQPQKASASSAAPLGPIGIALDGVPFFNQYAGPNQPLTSEIDSFDQYNGHPQMSGLYHYHLEPVGLTAKYGKSALLGFLLDGFPVYGPVESGKTLTSADLDACHGHLGATADYPQGIYHYHFTADPPYLNGAGFCGTPGSVGNR